MNQGIFNDVIDIYKTREPSGFDVWNPLLIEEEMWHRIRFLIALTRAIRLIDIPISEARILDVGCGVGRSTRTLLEIGAKPSNVIGIDIRPEAITYAKLINPGISFCVVNDFNGWPTPGSFDLCIQATAFSSIPNKEGRFMLAAMMEKMISSNGYIFWWDIVKANPFAGGDVMEPQKLFRQSQVIDYWLYHMRPTLVDVVIYSRIWGSRYHRKKINPVLERFLRKISIRVPSHCAMLFKKNS